MTIKRKVKGITYIYERTTVDGKRHEHIIGKIDKDGNPYYYGDAISFRSEAGCTSGGKGRGCRKPEIQAEIRKPESYVAPNTKASNELFGRNNEGLYMGIDKLKTEGKHSKKKITVALGITYKDDVDIGIRLSAPYTGTCLTAFDKVVHDAVVTLYVDGGNENITTNMIYQVISGNTDSDASKNPISKGLREAINESIDRMFHSWVKIDATEQAQIYGWDEGKYKGHVINCSILEASLNGQVTVCAHVCEPPILYRYANDCGQVIRYDVKMLDVPSLENSVECIILKTYLLQQIQIMSHNKDFSRTIMFDTIYEMLSIQAPTKDALLHKKKQIRGHVIKCLDYWTTEKLIDGYEVKKTGKTLDRVTLKVKLVKKKFITGWLNSHSENYLRSLAD